MFCVIFRSDSLDFCLSLFPCNIQGQIAEDQVMKISRVKVEWLIKAAETLTLLKMAQHSLPFPFILVSHSLSKTKMKRNHVTFQSPLLLKG